MACSKSAGATDSSLYFVTDVAPGTEAFTEALKNMDGVIALCQQGRLGIVQSADRCEEFLKAEGLLYVMRINCRLIGFDPSNRDKVGGNQQDVQALISAIKKAGWSDAAVAHATCVEINPGSTDVEEFNRKFSEGAPLMQVKPGSISFGSLSCGHNNYGQRAILASCPHPDPAVTKDGRLSIDKIRESDPRYAEAVEEGMTWKVLRHEVRQRYPEALRIIQAARNVFGHVQRQTTIVQGLKQMHNMASAFQSLQRAVDWEEVKRSVLDTQPPFAADIDFLINFLIGKSGGVADPHLDEYVVAHRMYVASSRRVPGELFAVLADLPWTHVAYALLFAAYHCDKKYVNKEGLCSYVQVAHVQAMIKAASVPQSTASSLAPAETKSDAPLLQKCAQAELMLSQARGRLPAAGVNVPPAECNELTKILCRLDEKVGQFLVGKESPISVLHEAGFRFETEILQFFGDADGKVLTQDWPQVVITDQPKAKTRKPDLASVQMYNLKAGVVQDTVPRLRALCMDTNSCVGRTDSPEQFLRVMRIAEQEVELREWYNDKADTKIVTPQELIEEYEAKKPSRPEKQLHPASGRASAFANPVSEVRLLCERAMFLHASSLLSAFCATYFPLDTAVHVYNRPRPLVTAREPCPIATLVLPPDTNRVNMCKTNPKSQEEIKDALCDKSVPIKRFTGLGPYKEYGFYLNPWRDDKQNVPAWCVETTPDAADANMVWASARVNLNTNVLFKVPPELHLSIKAPLNALDSLLPNWQEVPTEPLDSWVVIPVLINCAPLVEGDILRVFKEKDAAEEKKKEKKAPIKIDNAVKRRSTQVANAAAGSAARKQKR